MCTEIPVRICEPGECAPGFPLQSAPPTAFVLTRILSDGPCRGTSPADAGEEPPGERGEAKCTHFRRAKGGPVVLFNRCRACRAVVVERAGRGGARKSQTFAVAGGSYVPLAAPGVPVQARIVTEKPCG